MYVDIGLDGPTRGRGAYGNTVDPRPCAPLCTRQDPANTSNRSSPVLGLMSAKPGTTPATKRNRRLQRRLGWAFPRRWRSAAVLGLLLAAAGCVTFVPPPGQSTQGLGVTDPEPAIARTESPNRESHAARIADARRGRLLPGDVLQISYFLKPEDGAGYRIASGDALSIEVEGHTDLSLSYARVAPDGQLLLGRIGRTRAAGDTAESLASRLAFLYSLQRLKDPQVTVAVVERKADPKRFIDQMIVGNGGNTLTVALLADMTIQMPLIGAVQLGGSLAEARAEIRDAYADLFDDDLEVIVNLQGRSPRTVFVLGAVDRAQALPLTPLMTPLMAVETVGGLARDADPQKVVLLRVLPQGGYRYWVLNMVEGPTDPAVGGDYAGLLANDIVFVPRESDDDIEGIVEKLITTGLPRSLKARPGPSAQNLTVRRVTVRALR